MQTKVFKKFISAVLCFSLFVPSISFAGVSSERKTQQEIKVALSAPDRYNHSSNWEYIAWSIGVLAAGGIGYKAGHFLGEVKGFGRGVNALGGVGVRDMSRNQAAIIAKLEKQVLELQNTIFALRTATPAEDKVIHLMVRLNSQLASLKSKQTGRYEAEAIKKSIRKTIEDLSIAEVKDPATKRVLYKFLTQAEKSLGKKTVITALASLFVTIAITALVAGEEVKQEISSSRTIITRELSQAFKAGPQAFTIKALYLKQQYGLEVVSSVIYENQTEYFPVLQQQLAYFENPENRLLADLVTQDLASPSPAQNKAAFLDNIKKAEPLKFQTAI